MKHISTTFYKQLWAAYLLCDYVQGKLLVAVFPVYLYAEKVVTIVNIDTTADNILHAHSQGDPLLQVCHSYFIMNAIIFEKI